jgi:arachidonate 15-lipoxygenase
MPIAIQCGQDPLTWPVVLPTEGEAWMQAKTVVQIADADYYQLGVHVARTHLLVEPFPIATHNQLPSEHPLRRLLEPHFEGTLFVNAGVASTFLNPGGFADTVMSGTVDANRAVTLKSVFTRGFRSAYLPGWLANQGLDDPLKLPVYPFRDDALLIWGAIGDWIRAYVGVHWPDDATVVADTALQAWAREVTAFDGGRVPDFGEAANGEIRTRAYLERALQMIVWTASGMHAALNFPQGTVLTYTPAMPFAGYTDAQTPPPTTQADVLRLMPPLDQAIKQLNGQYLGGAIFHTRIGEYAGTRFEDTTVQAALRTFRERLLAIELIIDERNQRRRFPYEYLRPTRVPESINI